MKILNNINSDVEHKVSLISAYNKLRQEKELKS